MKEKRSLLNFIFGKKDKGDSATKFVDFKLLNGENVYFSKISDNIYDSKVARECIDRIATHCAKLVPKHIQDGRGHVKGDINYMLEYEPNPIMTKFDFLYKIVSQLYTNSNTFVFIAKDGDGNITGFYPVLAHDEKLLEDKAGNIFLQFKFINRNEYTLPYFELIHLRKFYNENDFFGTNNKALYTDLETVHTASEGIKNAIKTAMSIKGIIKYNAILKDEDIKKNKDRFVKDFIGLNNKSGIASLDGKGDFKEINLNPITLSESQLKQVNYNIFDYFGVSEKIINNDFSENEWNAFYEGVVEPIAIQMSDEFTRKIFSKNAIKKGHRIFFTTNRLQYASLATKVKLIHELAPYGMLKTDEGREIIDLPPLRR